MSKHFVVVAYDISNDRRRTRLYKALLPFGTPVQFSVFECLVTEKELETLKQKVGKLIKPTLDHVRYYDLCAACRQRIETTAAGTPPARHEDTLIV